MRAFWDTFAGQLVMQAGVCVATAVAVFVGVQGWRAAVWVSQSDAFDIALLRDFLSPVLYGMVALHHVRHRDQESVFLTVCSLGLATISLYGVLDASGAILASVPDWSNILRTGQSFLGVLDQRTVSITCLTMSGILAAHLITHWRRQH